MNKIDRLMQKLRKLVLLGSISTLVLIGLLGLIIPFIPGVPILMIGLTLYLKDEKNKHWIANSKIYQYLKRKFDL